MNPILQKQIETHFAIENEKVAMFNKNLPKGSLATIFIDDRKVSFDVTRPAELFLGRAMVFVKDMNLITPITYEPRDKSS